MNPKIPHIVIYSHGFGVRKESKGLFTKIALAVPAERHIMFDYNPLNKKFNTQTMAPLTEQVHMLRKVINEARAEYPEAVIDLVCHSQGCVVAGLLKPRGIRKVIMLAPPDTMSEESGIKRLSARSGQDIDVSTRTRLQGSDGVITVVPPEYWQSLAGVKPVKLYNLLARVTALRIINARQDDMLGAVDFAGLDPSVSSVTLDGNHNFDGDEARNRLLYILRKELTIE